MPRPGIVRADTIDLQDPQSPSAKDHSRHPAQPADLGDGLAPHQAETVREKAAEAEHDQQRSPRLSGDWTMGDAAFGTSTTLTGANLQQRDTLKDNAGSGEDADAEGDDDMDDDMMDKISSSPSIDDGGCPLPTTWPARLDSLTLAMASSASSFLNRGSSERSSSPFQETPVHFPLLSRQPVDPEPLYTEPGHHLSGSEYEGVDDTIMEEIDGMLDDVYDFLHPSFGHESHQDYMDYQAPDFDSTLMDADQFDSYDEGVYVNGLLDYDDRTLTIPYESSEEDDDDDCSIPEDSRFIDSGWGGECLQDLEDIDFEFVYALHTFVATVEGQANATKGDTMVLLDDSNSYWWLVRVVKDSSIGYLPAEHIETPTERLARLNKHRNIDLSAAMLGDQSDKPKNPLKKAMRRRNAKTVQFAAPTYVEASDVDYSSDEEDAEAEYYAQHQRELAGQQSSAEEQAAAGSDKSGDSKPKSEQADAEVAANSEPRTSDDMLEGKSEASRSRNGTVRNTDSFFKDDSVETKKITITPNLLRDDSSTSTRASNESKEVRDRVSIDKVEKEPAADKKEDRKKKEKKSGLLGGLFKRKDKKSKLQDEDADELIYGKKSGDGSKLSPVTSKDSVEDETHAEDATTTTAAAGDAPQRNGSKVQKLPRSADAPIKKPESILKITGESQQARAAERTLQTSSTAEPTLRLVQPETQDESTEPQKDRTILSETVETTSSSQSQHQRTPSTLSKMLRARSNSDVKEPKIEKVKKAKERMEMDEFDSSGETSPVEDPRDTTSEEITPLQRPIPGAFPDSYVSSKPTQAETGHTERLSESPVHVLAAEEQQLTVPPLMVDTSSQEEEHPSPVSSPSPELISAEEAMESKHGDRSLSASTATTTTTWSDSQLRTFFDDDSDIRDLLMVVYDKSGVVPAGPEHPLMNNLFKEENARLAEITNRLDDMLGDWLARKSRASGAR